VIDIFVERVHRTAPSTFGFTVVGSDVVELRARDLTIRDVHRLPYQDRRWAASVVADGRELYLFGRDYQAGPSTYLARASIKNPFGHWQFWTGRRWSTDPRRASAVLFYPPFNNPAMTRLGAGRWLAIAKDRDLDGTVVLGWTARRPQGRWHPIGPLVAAPTSGPPEFTYLAAPHPEIRVESGHLLVSWNINVRVENFNLPGVPITPYGPRFAVIQLPQRAAWPADAQRTDHPPRHAS
jgi:hypothetical protein